MQIGVISDTHGLLRPQSIDALRGCEQVIHAGDIGSLEILNALREIALVTAVRGNTDWEPWALDLPVAATARLASVGFHVVHDIAELSVALRSADFRVIVSGHSHRPRPRLTTGCSS
jgi:putative phosphoesterase